MSAPAAGGITADTVAQIVDAHGRPTRAPPPPGTPAGRSRSTAPVQFAASGTLTVRATDRNGTRLTLTRAIRAG